jgi:hypothetical protein
MVVTGIVTFASSFAYVIALTLPLAVTDSTVEALLPLFSADVVMPVAQAVDVKQDLENTKNKISIFILIDN